MKYTLLISISVIFFACEKSYDIKPSKESAVYVRNNADEELRLSIDTFINEYLLKLGDNIGVIIEYQDSTTLLSPQTFLNNLETAHIISPARMLQICSQLHTSMIAIGDENRAAEICSERFEEQLSKIFVNKSSIESNIPLTNGIGLRSLPCTDEFKANCIAIGVGLAACIYFLGPVSDGWGALGCAVAAGAAYYAAHEGFCTCLKTSYGGNTGGNGCN